MRFIIKDTNYLENYFPQFIGAAIEGKYIGLDGERVVELDTSPYKMIMELDEVEEV